MADEENPVPAAQTAENEVVAEATNGRATRRTPRRRPASKQSDTLDAVAAAGEAHAEAVPDRATSGAGAVVEAATESARRSRTRRRRTTAQDAPEIDPPLTDQPAEGDVTAAEPAAFEPPAVEPSPIEAQPAEPVINAESGAGASVEAASEAIIEPPTAEPPATPTSAWAPRRRYEIGPDGTVRFLDDRNRQAAVTTDRLAETPEPAVEPQGEPAETIAAEHGEETAAIAPPPSRRRGGRGSRGFEPDAPAVIAAEAVHEQVEAGDEVEAEPDVDDVAGIDQGFIEGEVSEEGGDPTRERRRRRSRRGGRGRRRNGVAAEGGEIEGGEALDADFAEAEGVALPDEPAFEPEELPRIMPARERSDRAGGGPTPLEALVARQNVILDQLLQRQERMTRSMEQALKSVEARLRGTDLSHVSAMPRIAVFVDVPNIMYAAEQYRVAVDFGKLLDYVAHDRTLIRASAYAPISDDPTQRLEVQRFVEPFVNHGYRIVTKPLKRFADGSIKANFDVELAMDILTMSDRLDIVSLVSGDGDFRRLVDIVASKGVRVEVVSFARSTSAELKAVADTYIDLTQHLKDLCVPVEGDFRPRVPRPRIDISGYYESGNT